MGWVWKGVPIPTLVALVLLIIGGFLHIIGVATPYWHEDYISNYVIQNTKNYHAGLWVACSSRAYDSFDCTGHGTVEGYVQATRALAILALLSGAVCIVVTGLWYFLKLERFNLVCMIGSLVSGFLSGLFGMLAIIIYAAEFKADTSPIVQLVDRNLSWSFALCTLSACLAIIATILIGLGTRLGRT